jgi:hypothetical protein
VRLCIAGFAALCGSVSLIYPFGRDQGSYGYAGWVLLEGGVPYRDVFVFKPPMTVVVHGLAMGLFGVNTWAIRALDIGWSAVTALVVAAIALELWNRRDAALAAGLTYPFLYYQIDYWNIAQTDGWMILPCAAGIWAVLRGGRVLEHDSRKAATWWLTAGVLVGIALLFKYTAATIGLPLLVALGYVASARGRRAWLGVPAIALGAAVSLGTCGIWLWGTGAWHAFIDSQLGLLPSYVERKSSAESLAAALERLTALKGPRADVLPLFWAAPVALAPALLATWKVGRAAWLGLGVVLIWWLAALANVLIQSKYFEYHYLPLIAPSALLVGLALPVLLRVPLAWTRRRELQGFVLVALIVTLIAVTPLGGRARDFASVTTGAQTIEQYIQSRREYRYPTYDVGEIRQVSQLLRDTTTREQRVFLWGYDPTINVCSRRRTVSRFLYNYPLRVSWGNPDYEAELMEALRSQPPDVVVVGSRDRLPGITGNYKDSKQLLHDFEELNAFVNERYEAAEVVGRYSLWRLRKTVTRNFPSPE